MRLLFEILIIGAVIYLAWDMPLKQRVDQLRGAVTSKPPATASREAGATPVPQTPPPTPAPFLRPIKRATPPPGAWMWDSKHRSTLDRPAYGQAQPVQRYQDPFGRHYWIDADGARHYDQ